MTPDFPMTRVQRACRRAILAAGALLAASAATAQPLDHLQIPPRQPGAVSGSQFKDSILSTTREEREAAILAEIQNGNVPDFLRTLKPVTITETITSRTRTATFYVAPDYVSIGSDADYFRMPMTPMLAQRVAALANCSLPTRKMVNAIYKAATCKLAPSPILPGPQMITVPVFWDHNVIVQGQRDADSAPLRSLVGGDKKDSVITPQLATFTTSPRVAIYGWHRLNGAPIQPLYLGHD